MPDFADSHILKPETPEDKSLSGSVLPVDTTLIDSKVNSLLFALFNCFVTSATLSSPTTTTKFLYFSFNRLAKETIVGSVVSWKFVPGNIRFKKYTFRSTGRGLYFLSSFAEA